MGLGTFLSPGGSSGKDWKAGESQTSSSWVSAMALIRAAVRVQETGLQSLLLPPVTLKGSVWTLHCLHRSLEFSEVTNCLLSLMSEVGQNAFLLLPPQNIDGKGDILSAWKLMVNVCWFLSGLGFACTLKWERVMKRVILKQSKLGIWKRQSKEKATLCNSSLSGKNRTLWRKF